MADLKGYEELHRRFAALKKMGGIDAMKFAGNHAVGRLRKNVPRKTSNTSRTIHVARVTPTAAYIEGNAVAKWLDSGTGIYGPAHHKITPQAAKAMRWMGGPKGAFRLSGSVRSGAAGAGAHAIFARSTKGMKARPYVQKSLNEVRDALGPEIGGEIIDVWNKAS